MPTISGQAGADGRVIDLHAATWTEPRPSGGGQAKDRPACCEDCARDDKWVDSLGGYASNRYIALYREAVEFAGEGDTTRYLDMCRSLDERHAASPGKWLAEAEIELANASRARALAAGDLPGAPRAAGARYGWDDLAAVIDLATSPVRTYRRTVMTPNGPRVEVVGAHTETRNAAGLRQFAGQVAAAHGPVAAGHVTAAAGAWEQGNYAAAGTALQAAHDQIAGTGGGQALSELQAYQSAVSSAGTPETTGPKRGWIPQAKWEQGQKEWIARGEEARQRMTDEELARALRRHADNPRRSQNVIDELDRRDEQDKSARLRALYAENPRSEADRSRVYQGLVDEGESPEDAWAHAHGTSHEAMQKQAVIADLRAKGHKGSGFDALTRDAFKDEVRRRVISAEGATNGYLLSPAGKKAGIDPWTLFTGPESRARKYASSELKEWWDQNGRPTAADFQANLMGKKSGAGRRDFYASVTRDDPAAVVELSEEAPLTRAEVDIELRAAMGLAARAPTVYRAMLPPVADLARMIGVKS